MEGNWFQKTSIQLKCALLLHVFPVVPIPSKEVCFHPQRGGSKLL